MTTLHTHDEAHVHDPAHGGHGHEHPPFLAHHWETPQQQFEAGKLGMWLFLVTEVMLFGGLFCAYSVWRGQHPELFKYGSHFLNTTLGAINTAVLIVSSLTMAWGVTCAQKSQKWGLILCLILTLLGAMTFLGIKYFEYKAKFDHGLFPGIRFYQPADHYESGAHPSAPHVEEGMADQRTPGSTPAHGVQQTDGEMVSSEHALVMGEVAAQAPAHPAPPSAGASAAPTTASASTTPAAHSGFELQTLAITPATAPDIPPVDAPSFAPAATGPAGLDPQATFESEPVRLENPRQEAHTPPLKDPARPPNTHMFFNIYFMMTGLHGVHVFVGMIIIGWLLVRAFKGHFNSEYFTPVDLGGLYWHIVDLIWIFLFPLFYLI